VLCYLCVSGQMLRNHTERDTQKRLLPVYEKRRPILKSIDKFWPLAMRNCGQLAVLSTINKDQHALAYLEDLWLERSQSDWRVFTLEFVSAPHIVICCFS
jgi:template-activating factor I